MGGRPSLSIIKTFSLLRYLHSKIESGDAHSISCPEYGCYKLVPVVRYLCVEWSARLVDWLVLSVASQFSSSTVVTLS